MMHARGIGRLGMLAVGLGVGAAIASTPGIASADPSTDPFSWLGGLDLFPAATTPDLNLAISFDGHSLVSDGTATATTTSGDYDLAIAYGDGATANAQGGLGDYAFADGADAVAASGGAPGDTGANFDTAIDIGTNTGAANSYDGAYAGDSDLIGATDGGTGSYDTAIDIGNNTNGDAGGNDGVFAGGGGLDGESGNGNYDTAVDIGTNSGQDDGAGAIAGNHDYASVFGDFTHNNIGTLAGAGNGNVASVVGNNSEAFAGGGNNDISYVWDPSGTEGSYAGSGLAVGSPGSNDIAAVLGLDDVGAEARGSDYLVDILTRFGDVTSPVTSSAAATGGGILADLFPSLGEGAASSAAADSGNLLADFLSLF